MGTSDVEAIPSVRYTKGKENNQDYALSILHTNVKHIPDDNDEIPTFFFAEDHAHNDDFFDLLHGENNEKRTSPKPEYTDAKEIIATMDEAAPPTSHFKPITIVELLPAQLADTFCAEIRRHLNKGERLAFFVYYIDIIVRTSDKGNQMFASNALNERIL